MAAAFIIVIVQVAAGRIGLTVLISLLALPQAVLTLRILWRGHSRQELASGVPASSRLHWYFGILLTIGVLLARYI